MMKEQQTLFKVNSKDSLPFYVVAKDANEAIEKANEKYRYLEILEVNYIDIIAKTMVNGEHGEELNEDFDNLIL